MKLDFPLVINEEPLSDDFLHFPGKMAKVAYEVAHWQWLRCRLSEAQNWKCCWCGVKTTDLRKVRHASTIEHVLPKSLGGSNEWENLAMSCEKCNNARGNMSADEFIEKLTGSSTPSA
jgi:5-methylcytosine-specific restriction endonuclease McrA